MKIIIIIIITTTTTSIITVRPKITVSFYINRKWYSLCDFGCQSNCMKGHIISF